MEGIFQSLIFQICPYPPLIWLFPLSWSHTSIDYYLLYPSEVSSLWVRTLSTPSTPPLLCKRIPDLRRTAGWVCLWLGSSRGDLCMAWCSATSHGGRGCNNSPIRPCKRWTRYFLPILWWFPEGNRCLQVGRTLGYLNPPWSRVWRSPRWKEARPRTKSLISASFNIIIINLWNHYYITKLHPQCGTNLTSQLM